ncbi:hypothetical protein SCHPADRAFT_743636 [Schizopora paradoxa]|uniref:Uncharacterized protein n=1 Tax=Schizopora paradoxa TaxID=27342 RepID=A0A0H2R0S3_9AGAM|nr:hypothetical protein SCHPADRAFT_743636 [Schizopora paradoxa]
MEQGRSILHTLRKPSEAAHRTAIHTYIVGLRFQTLEEPKASQHHRAPRCRELEHVAEILVGEELVNGTVRIKYSIRTFACHFQSIDTLRLKAIRR